MTDLNKLAFIALLYCRAASLVQKTYARTTDATTKIKRKKWFNLFRLSLYLWLSRRRTRFNDNKVNFLFSSARDTKTLQEEEKDEKSPTELRTSWLRGTIDPVFSSWSLLRFLRSALIEFILCFVARFFICRYHNHRLYDTTLLLSTNLPNGFRWP